MSTFIYFVILLVYATWYFMFGVLKRSTALLLLNNIYFLKNSAGACLGHPMVNVHEELCTCYPKSPECMKMSLRTGQGTQSFLRDLSKTWMMRALKLEVPASK